MSRQYFGQWGIGLDDEEFAQALAALSVTFHRAGTPASQENVRRQLENAIKQQESGAYTLRVRREFLWFLWFDPIEFLREGPAEMYRDAWNKLRAKRGPLRIELESMSPWLEARSIQPVWLMQQLALPEVSDAAYLQVESPEVPIRWDWPLRVGLLREARSQSLRKALELKVSNTWLNPLFRFIDPEAGGACNVLLLPYDLRGALQVLLESGKTLEADCVLVMGRGDPEPPRAQSLLFALHSQTRTSGVGVLHIPNEQRAEWFETFIRELSHNQPLDLALGTCARNHGLQRPLLVASRGLIESAQLSKYVERIGDYLAQARMEKWRQVEVSDELASLLRVTGGTRWLHEVGDELRMQARHYSFDNESREATHLVQLKRQLETTLNRKVVLPPSNWQTLKALPGRSNLESYQGSVERRAVKTRFLAEQVRDGTTPAQAVETLQPGRSYLLEARIGSPATGYTSGSEAFPFYQLPPSSTGHTLSIAFCELPRGGPAPSRPQVATIHLPPTGESTSCLFHVRTRDGGLPLVARLVVLHENRVLQTLRLTATPIPEGTAATPPVATTLVPETVVRQGFEELGSRQRFDAALVLNHSPEGTPGVTVVTGRSVSFLEPKGLADSVGAIRTILNQVTRLPEVPGTLADEPMVAVLRKLAHHGRLLWKMFAPRCGEVLASARRLQIVEAREGAFLPVEFFYARAAPRDDAPLCSHAIEALRKGLPPESCPSGDDDSVICPAAFWGFSRVLERCAHMDLQDNREYSLSEPTLESGHLDFQGRILLGASEKVDPKDLSEQGGLKEVLKQVSTQVDEAQTWDVWPAKIKAGSPSLLVLLPHSLLHPDEEQMAALEIGARLLRASQLERHHVCGPESKVGPVVLLLGCSTELTDIPFQNFVSLFKANGASLVLGTLSVIRGRHAVRFCQRLLSALKETSSHPGATFGEALLEVKRTMLAEGDPFVLTLAAYGDAGWRL